jgi:hypothetical protein
MTIRNEIEVEAVIKAVRMRPGCRCACGAELKAADLQQRDGRGLMICSSCHQDVLSIEMEIIHEG